MLIKMLKSKIHRATVTDKHLGYNGSIRIDPLLLEKSGLRAWENVLVVNIANGTRHETYVQVGESGSGEIVLNGAAARLGEVGDLVIIMAFAWLAPQEADALEPQVALVDEHNKFVRYLK